MNLSAITFDHHAPLWKQVRDFINYKNQIPTGGRLAVRQEVSERLNLIGSHTLISLGAFRDMLFSLWDVRAIGVDVLVDVADKYDIKNDHFNGFFSNNSTPVPGKHYIAFLKELTKLQD